LTINFFHDVRLQNRGDERVLAEKKRLNSAVMLMHRTLILCRKKSRTTNKHIKIVLYRNVIEQNHTIL